LTKLNVADLIELETLVSNHISFIDERLLPPALLSDTATLLATIDPNDTPFVALTTYLGGKLWTGDMQLYKGLKALQFKDIVLTADLAFLLDDLEQA
jgi:predicted nucleic acid-binding protein